MNLYNRRFTALALIAFSVCIVATASAAPVKRATTLVPVQGMELLPAVQRGVDLGPVDRSTHLHMAVSLPYRNVAEVEAFVDSVSDPTSPNYRQFITPAEVGERFGLSTGELNAVVTYLQSKGLTVKLVAKNRLNVLIEGSAAQAEAAFGTSIHKFYAAPTNKYEPSNFYANATPVRLPANIAGSVLDVSGLTDFIKPAPRNTSLLTPPLTQGLYNLKPMMSGGLLGQGRTVGVTNFDGFHVSDAAAFVQAFALPTPAGGPASNVEIVTISGGAQNGGAAGEGDLDIQMELGTAPLANIIVYDGGQSDLIGTLTAAANEDRVDTISESWGWNIDSSTATAAHNIHLSMSSQGITYMAASGDSGTSLEPFSYPNYDGEVLMVGGTVATVADGTGARVSEVAWNGGGGGWSTNPVAFNKLPTYQKGPGVPTNINFRLSPDIALHAAGPQGAYVFYFGGGANAADGTSFASPVFAGSLALAEQKAISLGGLPPNGAGKRRVGRFQDAVYLQAGRPDVYFDVVSGNNGILPDGTSSDAKATWDFCTGYGAVNFDALGTVLASGSSVVTVTGAPDSIAMYEGATPAGNITSVAASDNKYYTVNSKAVLRTGQVASATLTFKYTKSLNKTFTLGFKAEGSAISGVTGSFYVWDYTTSSYTYLGSFPMGTADVTKSFSLGKPFSKYVDATTKTLKVLVRSIMPNRTNVTALPFKLRLDQVQLKATTSLPFQKSKPPRDSSGRLFL